MKTDPCETCIVQVNCTKLCIEKEFYRDEIKHILSHYKSGRGSRKRHNLLMRMLALTYHDEVMIEERIKGI